MTNKKSEKKKPKMKTICNLNKENEKEIFRQKNIKNPQFLQLFLTAHKKHEIFMEFSVFVF